MRENFQIHPDFAGMASELKSILLNFSARGSYLNKGSRNTIKKITVQDRIITVKQFKIPVFFQSYVYRFFRKSKAERSYRYGLKLIDAGIKTPFPIAYYERFSGGLKDSFYVCEFLDYDFEFRELIHNPEFENREEILRLFARFTFDLHENRIHFLDHSPGNTLIMDRGSGQYDFYLIDLNRMRFESMSFKKRMRNFRRLSLSKTMIRIIADEYSRLYNRSYDETFHLMLKYSRKFRKNRIRKRILKARYRHIFGPRVLM